MTNAVNDSQILCRLKMSFSVLLTKSIKVSDIKYFENNDIAPAKFWPLPVKYPVPRHQLGHALLILLLLQLLQSLIRVIKTHFPFLIALTWWTLALSSLVLHRLAGLASVPAWAGPETLRDPGAWNTMCTAWPGASDVVIGVIICESGPPNAPGVRWSGCQQSFRMQFCCRAQRAECLVNCN